MRSLIFKVALFYSTLMIIQSLIGYALFQQVKDDEQLMLAAIQALTMV